MDLKRFTMLHVVIPPLLLPQGFLDGVEEQGIRRHSQNLAKTLGRIRGHHFQYHLIKSYHFETAVLDGDLGFGLSGVG